MNLVEQLDAMDISQEQRSHAIKLFTAAAAARAKAEVEPGFGNKSVEAAAQQAFDRYWENLCKGDDNSLSRSKEWFFQSAAKLTGYAFILGVVFICFKIGGWLFK